MKHHYLCLPTKSRACGCSLVSTPHEKVQQSLFNFHLGTIRVCLIFPVNQNDLIENAKAFPFEAMKVFWATIIGGL